MKKRLGERAGRISEFRWEIELLNDSLPRSDIGIGEALLVMEGDWHELQPGPDVQYGFS